MIRSTRRGLGLTAVALVGLLSLAPIVAAQGMGMHPSKKVSGAKVNAGTVSHVKEGSKDILELSTDFKVPDTPDPHWQVVDSKGRVFLLQRLGETTFDMVLSTN